MFSRLFKKPTVDAPDNMNLMQAEQALQTRVNRMMRQNLKVDWTPPPMRPEMTPARAKAEALRPKS